MISNFLDFKQRFKYDEYFKDKETSKNKSKALSER